MTEERPQHCEIAVRHAVVVDGSGAARFRGDLAVTGERIVAIGELGGMTAELDIDAAGKVVAPGFIDVHTHDDNAVLVDGAMLPKVSQGVTTVVTGNCGISLAPLILESAAPPPLDLLGGPGAYRFATFAEYIEAFRTRPAAINVAPMVGHSTLRVATMSDLSRPANDGEIAAMQALLQEAMDAGAVGLSTGLFYPTGRAAPPEEVVALLTVLTGTGAVYATHMRDEGDRVEESLKESFETASRAGVPLVISHHKCLGTRNFGRSRATLARIDEARRRQPVGLDVYPYAAASTVLLPEFVERANRVLVTWSRTHPEATGRELGDVAAEWGVSLGAAIERLVPAGAVYFMMDEEDVEHIMSYPPTMIGSDGLPHDEHPHPRLWGTFPRVLGHYVRDRGILTLEEAVHKMTGLTAAQFGLADRGLIEPGAFADLVVFDPETVADRATFASPKQVSAGIELVMVAGEVVYRDGQATAARPGRMLLRQAMNGSHAVL